LRRAEESFKEEQEDQENIIVIKRYSSVLALIGKRERAKIV
jgi:hypothetical protein